MRAVDTHVHLDFSQFDADRSAVIEKLAQDQIGVINISSSLESIPKVLELTKNPLIWGAIGLHPDEINEQAMTSLPVLFDQWSVLIKENSKIVAVGEVGLDYHEQKDLASANRQKAALKSFLQFAHDHDLPLIFHCREAYGDLLTILHDYPGIRGVVHCFSADQSLADQFLSLGLYLSFTGMITYPKNDSLREVTKTVSLEKIMIETDCPFLPPQEKRGQRNDPWGILSVAQTLAEQKGLTQAEVLEITSQNAQNLFKL